ncbi:hypothetical protein [Oryzicola mucosus]|uniref:Uncharacterized protein n=1 Tax=Oryzicola mucosus TaxID=2767425 RepID=A0A8J6U122_9HYPH|nr:hypothetical protein [Oryzicola mucosus]MBD0416501.1 hypothetical protein [Oryzicola mucosus]
MQRKIIDLPRMFGPLVSEWNINPRGRSAGEGVTGSEQVNYGVQPRWEATLNLSGFRPAQVLAWRAIKAQMRGRVNILRVPLCDMHRTTWKQLGIAAPLDPGLPYGDGTLHSDGTGYEPENYFFAPATIEAGAEDVTFNASLFNDALKVGQWFSHNDWPYLVTGIFDEPGGLTRYTIEPPMRRDIPAGGIVKLAATALMAFSKDDEGRMSLDMGKRGVATLNLVEWVNRP